MSKKQNKNWKLRIIFLLIFMGTVFFLVKTKTTWLDSDLSKKPKKKHEAYYIAKLAKELGGKEEVKVDGGRADIVTDNFAIEVEWASKWKSAIGQALWYGLETNRDAKIILLIKDIDKEYKYYTMLNSALRRGEIKMKTEAYDIKRGVYLE